MIDMSNGSCQTTMTLLDVARAGSPGVLPVVEALSSRNTFLQDMVWVGPATTGHRITMESRLFP